MTERETANNSHSFHQSIRRRLEEAMDRAFGREGAFAREQEAITQATGILNDLNSGAITIDELEVQMNELEKEDALKGRVARRFLISRRYTDLR